MVLHQKAGGRRREFDVTRCKNSFRGSVVAAEVSTALADLSVLQVHSDAQFPQLLRFNWTRRLRHQTDGFRRFREGDDFS